MAFTNAVGGPDQAPYLSKAGGTMAGPLNLYGSSPTATDEAASKGYVDAVFSQAGIAHRSQAASVSNLNATYSNGISGVGATLISNVTGVFSIDGISPAINSFVLIKNQSSQVQNGFYAVTDPGSVSTNYVLTRDPAYDSPFEIAQGLVTYVLMGNTQSNSEWMQTNIVAVVGADPISFSQIGTSTFALKGANSDITSLSGITGVINNPTAINFAPSGVINTGSLSGNSLSIQGYDTNDSTYRSFVSITSGNIPSISIQATPGSSGSIDNISIGSSTAQSGAFTSLSGQSLSLTNVSNQIVMGTSNTTTINSIAPASNIIGTIRDFGSNFVFAQATAGFNAFFNTSGNTTLTLPTTGTVATLSGVEALTNKTINGMTITPTTGTFTLGLGKTLSISNTVIFSGTDGSTLAFGTGGTIAYRQDNLGVFSSTTSLQLASVISDETGGGSLVFANTPTLVSPILGTPTSGNLTNCTNLPLASVTGLGAGVATFLATPTSSNLASAVTDETGSGALVFSNTPILSGNPMSTTPAVGDNSTSIATTAFVTNAVNTAISNAPTKASCAYASVAALPTVTYSNGASGVGATLTASANGALSLDGGSPTSGQRVLIKNQASGLQNGIYVVTNAGSVSTVFVLTRAADFDQTSEVTPGSSTFINNGTSLDNTTWQMITDAPIVVGTTTLQWTQVAGPGSYVAGTGLTLSGSTFSITNTGVTAATYGSQTTIPSIAINAQGQITSANVQTVIANAGTLSGTTLASNVVSSSLTSVGTITAGIWNGTAINGSFINYNTTNLRVTSNQLNTIQDISTSSTPAFSGVITTSISHASLITFSIGSPISTTIFTVTSGGITMVNSAITSTNSGLRQLSTNPSFYTTFVINESQTANRLLNFVMGDQNRTLTLSGNPTLGDWFDQAVKTTSSPTFVGVNGNGSSPLLLLNSGAAVTLTSTTLVNISGASTGSIDIITSLTGTAGAIRIRALGSSSSIQVITASGLRIEVSTQVTVTGTFAITNGTNVTTFVSSSNNISISTPFTVANGPSGSSSKAGYDFSSNQYVGFGTTSFGQAFIDFRSQSPSIAPNYDVRFIALSGTAADAGGSMSFFLSTFSISDTANTTTMTPSSNGLIFSTRVIVQTLQVKAGSGIVPPNSGSANIQWNRLGLSETDFITQKVSSGNVGGFFFHSTPDSVNFVEIYRMYESETGINRSYIGATTFINNNNSSTAASSHARINMQVENTNGNYPYSTFVRSNIGGWAMGMNTNASNRFDIVWSTITPILGVTPLFSVTTTGVAGISDGTNTSLLTPSAGILSCNTSFSLPTLGTTFRVKIGNGGAMGSGSLTGGSVTVVTTAVKANSCIFLSSGSLSGLAGSQLRVSSITAGNSFNVTSNNGLDNSAFYWIIFDAA